mgnify:CR=1 FL=1
MLLPFLLCMLIVYVPPPGGAPLLSLGAAAGGTGALVLLYAVLCLLSTSLALRLARSDRAALRRMADGLFTFLKGLMVGLVAGSVFVLQWPTVPGRLLGLHRWAVLVDELLLLLPILTMAVALMAARYRFESRRHRVSVDLVRYLWLRCRVELGIVLAPWLTLVLVTDLTYAIFAGSSVASQADSVATGALLILLVVFSPVLLRLIWATSRLPEGDLRDRLEDLCEEYGFRCHDILLWHTHRHLANAGVVGPTPLVRYVLLTDALVEHFTADEIEAVFAHEMGHVARHHLPFYLLLAGGFLFFYATLLDLLALAGWVGPLQTILALEMTFEQAVILLTFAGVYWGVIFGFISRRMEMEADLFSFRASDRPEAFLTALDKLGALSRRPRKKSFWRHFSIDRRMELLERLLETPGLADRLQRKINALKWAVGGLALAALLRLLMARPEIFRLW